MQRKPLEEQGLKKGPEWHCKLSRGSNGVVPTERVWGFEVTFRSFPALWSSLVRQRCRFDFGFIVKAGEKLPSCSMPPVNLFFSTFNASFLLPGNFKLLWCGVFVPACHQQYHSCYLESLNIDVLQGFVTERYGWADCTFHRRCLVSLHGVFKAQISFTRLIQISLELSWSHFKKHSLQGPLAGHKAQTVWFSLYDSLLFSRSQMVQQFFEETVSILASHLPWTSVRSWWSLTGDDSTSRHYHWKSGWQCFGLGARR